MDILKRFGVSIEGSLLKKFDNFIEKHSYENRSEAIRDLIRKELVGEEWVKRYEKINKILNNFYRITTCDQSVICR